MQQGAEAVHSANKNVLVILSGLTFDTDLSFVRSRPVNLSFTGKLVFELHWYTFSDGNSWAVNNPNDNCGHILTRIENAGSFLLNQGFPLFLSEFGIDERGISANDEWYFGCLTGWAVEKYVDWSLWALSGSYYLRQGMAGMTDYYGVLDSDWINVQNSIFLQKIFLLQYPLQGPGLQIDDYDLIFHPFTGLCLVRSLNDPTKVILGPCNSSERWSYTTKVLRIKDQPLCLQSNGPKIPVTMTRTSCSESGSKWQPNSPSRMHLSSTTSNEKTLFCLDVDATNNVVANACKCMSNNTSCEPMSQWFKIIKATRPLERSNLYKQISSLDNLSPKSDLL